MTTGIRDSKDNSPKCNSTTGMPNFPFQLARNKAALNAIPETIQCAIWLKLDIKIENINYQSTNAERQNPWTVRI